MSKIEISKAEFDKLAKEHSSREGRTGFYANAVHCYRDDRGNVRQTYSHPSHNLTMIECAGDRFFKLVK